MNSFKTSEKLEIWRKRKGMTQQDLADKLGITRQTLIIRIKENVFKAGELMTLKTLGFEE
jgi:DNA-binding XRE family transcriptional regulator